MMSVKIDKDDVKELACSGSMLDLLAEVGFAVHLIYNMIARSSPPCGGSIPESPCARDDEPEIADMGEERAGLPEHRSDGQAEGGRHR